MFWDTSTRGLVILGAIALFFVAVALLAPWFEKRRKPLDPDNEWTACHACRELMAPGAWGVFFQGKVYCSDRCIPAKYRLYDAETDSRARKAGL